MAKRMFRRVDSAYSSCRKDFQPDVSESPALLHLFAERMANRFSAGGFLFSLSAAFSSLRRLKTAPRGSKKKFLYPFQDVIYPIKASGIFFSPKKRNRFVASYLIICLLFQTAAFIFIPNDIFKIPSANASADWFDADYNYRKLVTIDHTKVAGNLANFPVLVSLTDPALKSTSNGGRVVNSTYLDIMFANAAGSAQLDHEIEKYDPATGEIVAWVKVSELSATEDTQIYMYYGNSALIATEEDKAGVWDDGGTNNFKGVWHLGETGTTTAGDYRDSTQYGNHSTNTANQPTATTGRIDSGQSFNGTDDSVELGGISHFNFSNNFNICTWAKWAAIGRDKALVAKSGAYKLDTTETGQLRFTTLAMMDYESTFVPVLNTWYHVCVNMTSSNAAEFYIDGQLYQSVWGPGPALSSVNPLDLGRYDDYYFNGSLDEVRISSTARSAAWIATEYQNQSNPTEFSSLGIEEVANAPALSSFGYRKSITIDHTKVSGDLANFPVLISLPTDASLAAYTQDDFDDILFTSSNIAWNTGTVNDKLAHEIESFDSDTGELVAWVKIPELSSTVDTTIYMYYGNGSIASQQNQAVVWDSSTKMVQHLSESPANGTEGHLDSTVYGNDGTPSNFDGIATSTTAGAGQIAGGDVFDGANDYVSVGGGESLSLRDEITGEAWVKMVSESGQRTVLSSTGYYLVVPIGSNSPYVYTYGVAGGNSLNFNSALPLNSWHHLAFTYDADGGEDNLKTFVDGSLTNQGSRTGLIDSLADPLVIGAHFSGGVNGFNGSLDEVRLASTARSAAWIATEYQNQSNPTEFYSVGIEEVSSPAALSSFGYRKAITIDHAKVSGDLTNFPVLVSLPTDASLAAHAQGDGDDILFASSGTSWSSGTVNDKLASEIESYDSTTGALTAWVKVPSLSSSADTTIYLYYGNAGIASQQNKAAVWDNRTKMVQHMNQNPAGAAPQMLDSTGYANNGTTSGTMTSGNSVSGQVNGATSFEGTDDYVNVGNAASVKSPQGSLSFWVKPAAFSADGYTIFHMYETDITDYLRSFVYSDGKIDLAIEDGDVAQVGVKSAASLTAGAWTKVSWVQDGSSTKLYLNGALSATTGTNSGSWWTNHLTAFNTRLGGPASPWGAFNGSLDEVRLAGVARSAQWIATEYRNESAPTEFYSVGIEEVSSPAALSSFGYRKAITIDHTKVSGDLTNFPVLISLPPDANLAAHAQSDADDILFTSNSVAWNTGTVNDKLAHEIEKYTAATGELVAWVKIPNLSSSADTTIYIYYGNAGVASQQNKTVVWDASTKMVQHMNQDPSGTLSDSTQYANSAISRGSMTSANLVAGKVGGAIFFDGTDDYVDAGNNASLTVGGDFSLSVWINTSAGMRSILEKIGSKYNYQLQADDFEAMLKIYDGSAYPALSGVATVVNGQWHHLVAVRNTTEDKLKLYVDGVLDGQTADTTTTDITAPAGHVIVGARGDLGASHFFAGSIDDVRISNVARSDQWILTGYQNQSNPTEFYSVGIEEVFSPAALSSFGFRRTITIDHTKVSGDLTNFPVLVNLPTDASLADHAQNDFDDILFTASGVSWTSGTANDKLAHEIESYDADTGKLVAWVKVPALSSATDTVIYMYYGNSGVASQQNKTAVWDNCTKLVQHMNQNPANPAPQMLDSTRYANNGTTGGTMTADDQVAGKVDGALDFDGSNDYVDCGDPDRTVIRNAVTASAWIKTTNMTTYKTVLTRRLSSTYGSYALTPTSATEFNFVVRSNGGNRKSPTLSIATLNDGVLHHLVGTYDGTKIRLYLDGAEIGSGTTYYGTVDTPNGGFWIARNQTGGEYLNSIIDEVRVSNTARSAAWIATEYQNQYSPSTFYALGAEQIYQFEVTGSGTQTAGTGQTVTVTAKDAAGNAMAGLDGDLAVIFTGADASLRGTNPTCRDKDGNDIAFGESTVLAFTDGVASCLMKLYKAETANISISGMSVSSTALSVSVTSGAPDSFLVNLPASSDSGASFAATITARDYEYNLADISGTTALSASTGTITPASVSEGSFTGGVWSGNLTISDVTERPSVTVTATNGSAAGTDAIIITGVPQAPGSVSASRNTDYSITVTWQDSSTVETGYVVERSMDSGSGFGSYQEIGTVEADVASFTDDIASNPADMPLPDRAYRYRVKAYNALGNSAYASDSMTHYTTPNAPSGVGAERLNDVSFRINYTDNAAVTDTHRIERCSNGNCDVSFETNLGTFTSSPQTDSSGIAADSRYRWQARAETPDGVYSAYSASNYEYTAPDAPTIGTVTVISPTEILVSWTDNSAYEDGFRLEVSIDGGAWQEVTSGSNTVGANIYSYSYASAADHNYKFRLRAHIGATSHNSELFSVYSAESDVVYTSLSAPTIQSPVVNSSASIT